MIDLERAVPRRHVYPGPTGEIVRYTFDCPHGDCGIAGAFPNPRARDGLGTYTLAECRDQMARCRRCGRRARLVPPGEKEVR